jgi:hypothetical protein
MGALPIVSAFFAYAAVLDRGAEARVSPAALVVNTRSLLLWKTATFPAGSILELVRMGGPVPESVHTSRARWLISKLPRNPERLLVRSSTQAVEFGIGLSSEELEWLRALIWNVVSA